MHQSGYINTTIDPRQTDVDNTVEYDECGENVDKSIYEQISTERDSSNHDYIVLTSTLEAGSKQVDNQVHQKKQAQLRQIFLILLCIIITASVTAVVTFSPTKQLMERYKKYSTIQHLTMHQSGYINTTIDPRQTDVDNTVEYEECGENVDKSIYEQLSTERDSSNHDYIVLTSTLEAGSKQVDNQVHQKKQAQLRQIFLILFCIIITASVTAVVTFSPTKQLMEMYKKLPCSTEPCENRGTCLNDTCLCNNGFAGSKCEIDVIQTCKSNADTSIPHPNTCKLYYNCSQAVSPLPKENRRGLAILRPVYLHECHYPELFSTRTLSCQNYADVTCGSRYETKNKCDYLADGYVCYVACKPCIAATPNCVNFECRDERNIYNGENLCQSNNAPYNGKCQDLFEIPPSNYQVGYGIDCSGRTNGNYKNDKGRCDIYYTCVNGNSTLTYCSSGKNFDTKTSFCQNPDNACTPCGSVSDGC